MQQEKAEDCVMRSFITFIPTKYYSIDQDKENRIGGTCGAYSVVWCGNLKAKETTSET
jgi:hypothetical protein